MKLIIGLGDLFFVGAVTTIELEVSGVGELVIYREHLLKSVSRRWKKGKEL